MKNWRAILLIVALFVVLVALNFAFLTDESGAQENEQSARRSSYLTTPYGTSALYTLLEESGHEVTRLQRPFTDIEALDRLGTLVIIEPPARNNPSAEEFERLSEWIEAGGLLIVIDREIQVDFGGMKAATSAMDFAGAARPLQPSRLTSGANRLELSRFATRVEVEGGAPTYHFGNDAAAVLADARLGEGRVVMLTDPYVVANNGLAQADNAALALNLFAGRPAGAIGFDEYHHGYGATSQGGGLMAYFRGTPFPWMLGQAALIAALAAYSYGRRFARPLPLRRERRTTNLEFVASMANITRLARASDLAMQSVYAEFRKRLCRRAGLPPGADDRRVAASAARLAGVDEAELLALMQRCEAVARGEKVADAELLAIVARVREIESRLRV